MSDQKTYQTILETLKEFEPNYVAIFGSRARGDHNENSDLDLLVEFNIDIDLIQFIGMEQELSKILGYKVDLVTRTSLCEMIKPYVDQDLIVLKDEKR